jgi:diguanylate cyclase (GGDEF)-like protein
LFLLVIFLPFAYFDSGGSANNAIGYVFLLLISIIYMFNGKRRTLLAGLLIMIFPLLLTLEYYCPHMVKVYPAHTQYVDRLIQIPLHLTAAFLMIRAFANAYEVQKNQEQAYSAELELLNAKLEFKAHHDPLTRLKNRRAFDNVLQDKTADQRQNLYVVLFDLDHFKQINDTLGHLKADEILIEFSKKLLKYNSKQVMISRWGGDEFGMLIEESRETLVQMINEIQEEYCRIVTAFDIDTKVSFGIAKWKSNWSTDEVLTIADQALYQAKQSGRGKMIFAPDIR